MRVQYIRLIVSERLPSYIDHVTACALDHSLGGRCVPFAGGPQAWIKVCLTRCDQTHFQRTAHGNELVFTELFEECVQAVAAMASAAYNDGDRPCGDGDLDWAGRAGLVASPSADPELAEVVATEDRRVDDA